MNFPVYPQFAAAMDKKDRRPPTEPQLERIGQLLEIPGMSSYVYDDMGPQKFANLISTMRGAGLLIGIMKKRANIK